MSKLASFPGGLLLGAGLMYFLDPIRGTRRRRRINDAVLHAQRVERDLLGKAARDAKQRIHGFTEHLRHPTPTDVPDWVIEERVRARLGRAVSHPGAIDVVCNEARVILRGPVFANEADGLIREVRRVPGVREVFDSLERHMTSFGVPALQGDGRMRRRRTTWPPAFQVAASGSGALMLLYGLAMRRGITGIALGAAGATLLARATTNRPVLKRAGVTVTKTILVHRPINEVFDLWSRLDNFPMFMEHVREVDLEIGGRRTRWTVDGPAGTKLQFEAETTEFEPDRVIAWKTVPDQMIEHEGRVRFEDVPEGTRVHVQMTYRPPGGVVGHAIAHTLGWDPKARMNDDLQRMKTLLEEGRTRAHHERVELADLH